MYRSVVTFSILKSIGSNVPIGRYHSVSFVWFYFLLFTGTASDMVKTKNTKTDSQLSLIAWKRITGSGLAITPDRVKAVICDTLAGTDMEVAAPVIAEGLYAMVVRYAKELGPYVD